MNIGTGTGTFFSLFYVSKPFVTVRIRTAFFNAYPDPTLLLSLYRYIISARMTRKEKPNWLPTLALNIM